MLRGGVGSMDNVDKQILNILQLNGRITNKAIAESIGLSTPAVLERIKKLEKSNVIKPLIRLIKQGKASGILIDTNINQKEGTIVEFMGKPIRQTTTPAYLARKFDAAIIPVTIRTDDEEHYTLMLFDEIPVEKTENEQADIQKATQLQADWLTSIITKEPKFWFWLHRRWKNDKPEIYKDI